MRVQSVKIKVFKKPVLSAFSTWRFYIVSVDTIFCWFGSIKSDFKQFQATWKYHILLLLCFLGVKFLIVDKPQIPTNIAFYDRLYEPIEVFLHTSLKAGTCSSMTSLLAHTVAQPTKWRFLPKNLNQLPYARHYNPRFVFILPHFSLRLIFKSGLYCREVSNYMIFFHLRSPQKIE